MTTVLARYASGISALLAGGYSVIGSTGGFTRVLTEEVMLVVGGVAVVYGIALVANKQASLAGAGGIGLVGVAGLMILTQLLYDPTPAFADGGVWNDSPRYAAVDVRIGRPSGVLWIHPTVGTTTGFESYDLSSSRYQ